MGCEVRLRNGSKRFVDALLAALLRVFFSAGCPKVIVLKADAGVVVQTSAGEGVFGVLVFPLLRRSRASDLRYRYLSLKLSILAYALVYRR